jgi:PilZ domain
MMWEDYHYCWVVRCKNHWFHLRQNIFYRHRILLGEADVYSHSPNIKGRFKVRCDACHQEYVYKPSDVMKYEEEPPESFSPHPLFRLDSMAPTNEMTVPDTAGKGKGKERRRNQRRTVKVEILVHGKSAENETFQEEAFTVSVSAFGALVAMRTPVAIGETLALKNLRNQNEIKGRVTRSDPTNGGLTRVAIEFVPPAPDFW